MNTLSQQNILSTLMNGEKNIDPSCPSRQLLSHITSRWGTLVLIALQEGVLRFSELRHKMPGISERMLTKVLRDLGKDGLILKESLPVIPPHTEYRLSPSGKEVSLMLSKLTDWISHYQAGRDGL